MSRMSWESWIYQKILRGSRRSPKKHLKTSLIKRSRRVLNSINPPRMCRPPSNCVDPKGEHSFGQCKKLPRPSKKASTQPALLSTIATSQYKKFMKNLPLTTPSQSCVQAPFNTIPSNIANALPTMQVSIPNVQPTTWLATMPNLQRESLTSGFANLYRYFTTSLYSC